MRPIPKSQFNFLVQLCLSQNNVFVGPLAIDMAIFRFFKNSFAKCFCSWLQALSSQISHLDGTSGLSRAKFAGNVFNRAAIINCLDGHQRTAFEDIEKLNKPVIT